MYLSDIYLNDLLYYKQCKQHDTTEKNKLTNDIERKIIMDSIPSKIIELPRKKKKIGTFYMIEREVYYHEYDR